jgi:hypothetical protein
LTDQPAHDPLAHLRSKAAASLLRAMIQRARMYIEDIRQTFSLIRAALPLRSRR